VKHTESSIFTEVVSQIADNTSRIADSLEAMHLREEIKSLSGQLRTDPVREIQNMTPVGRVALGVVPAVMAILFTCFGLYFAMTALNHRAGFIFVIFGSGFAIIGLAILVSVIKGLTAKAKPMSHEEVATRQKLVELNSKLANLTKA
jgi:hypothetical protein